MKRHAARMQADPAWSRCRDNAKVRERLRASAGLRRRFGWRVPLYYSPRRPRSISQRYPDNMAMHLYAQQAKVLAADAARRIAAKLARLPELLRGVAQLSDQRGITALGTRVAPVPVATIRQRKNTCRQKAWQSRSTKNAPADSLTRGSGWAA
jgi:hypothetical protein